MTCQSCPLLTLRYGRGYEAVSFLPALGTHRDAYIVVMIHGFHDQYVIFILTVVA